MLLLQTDDLERLGDEIAALSARVDAPFAQLLRLIREFDDRFGWRRAGFRSCADWLAWRSGLDPGAARERVRVARALGGLPRFAEALGRGELSYAKVRALTRVATPASEARLLAIGRTVTAAQAERIVRGWPRDNREVDLTESRRRHANRALHVYTDERGMVVIHGRLDPEAGAVLVQALTAAQDVLYRRERRGPISLIPPPEPNHEQQRADALLLVAESALHHELDPGAPAERYHVILQVDSSGESSLGDGTHVSAETSERLSCDASRTWIRDDEEGNPVEVSKKSRTIPPAIRRALLHRDQVCRFPGCERRFVQAHHIRHWAHGGPTVLSNLVLLCRYHHRAVHEDGYLITRHENGVLTFHRPDGQAVLDVP